MNFGLRPQSILYKVFIINNINLLFIYIFPHYNLLGMWTEMEEKGSVH